MPRVRGIGEFYKPLSATDVLGAQNAMMQYKLGKMKMRDYEKKLGRQENVENILRESYTPARAESMVFPQQTTMPEASYRGGDNVFADTYGGGVAVPGQPGRFDYPGAETALMGAGEYEAGMKIGEAGRARTKGGLDIQKSQLDIMKAWREAGADDRKRIKDNMELFGSATSGIYSQFKKLLDSGMPADQAAAQIQPLYERSVGYLKRQGMNTDKLSPRFDPIEIEAAMNISMGVKNMLTLEETKRKTRVAERKAKKEYTPATALKRISAIETAINRLQTGDKIDNVLMMAFKDDPEITAMLGGDRSPESVARAIAALETEREYVSRYAPKKAATPRQSEFIKPTAPRRSVEVERGAQKPMSEMPAAAQHSGRVVKDTESGKRYRSNGTKWVEIRVEGREYDPEPWKGAPYMSKEITR